MDRDELITRLQDLEPEYTELLREFGADEPDWGPLEDLIPLAWCGSFMFMGYVGEIRMYKHELTRRYLNIDPQGNTYGYLGTSNEYQRIPTEEAVEAVFEGLEEMGFTRGGDHAAMREERYRRMEAAGWKIIRLGEN